MQFVAFSACLHFWFFDCWWWLLMTWSKAAVWLLLFFWQMDRSEIGILINWISYSAKVWLAVTAKSGTFNRRNAIGDGNSEWTFWMIQNVRIRNTSRTKKKKSTPNCNNMPYNICFDWPPYNILYYMVANRNVEFSKHFKFL